MAAELNRFLTTLDASFLYFERAKEPLHIGSCMIYEGRVTRADLERLLRDRLHLVPRYRQKVVFPPLSISHPLWTDDPDFDLAHHLAEVELPPGADAATLAEHAARAYEGMLDRRHPLWHMTVLTGLPGDHTAVVWKVHHAMIDGVSGVDLTMALHEWKADGEPPPPPDQPWRAEPQRDPMTLLQESVQHRLTELARSFTDTTFGALRPEKIAQRTRLMRDALTATLPTALRPAPRTPWNKRVSGKLGWAWAELSFTEMRQIKGALGGTVNDLVLAVIAGGLGRYLRAHGQVTEGVELRAMCPVSMRPQAERGALGNLVSTMIAPLYVGITDPVERFSAERRAMERLKDAGQAEAFYELTRFGDQVPPLLQAWLGMIPATQFLFNTVSTNVPGPQIPLYLAGRRLRSWLPMGVVTNNVGLFVAILTYNQRITLGTTVDRVLVPDCWFLAECLEASLSELRAVAGVARQEVELAPVALPAGVLAAKGLAVGKEAPRRTRKPPGEAPAERTRRKKSERKPRPTAAPTAGG